MGTPSTAPWSTAVLRPRHVISAVVLAYASVYWLQTAVLVQHTHGASPLWHLLRDGTLAVPAVLVAILTAERLTRRLARDRDLHPVAGVVVTGVATAVALGAASPFHALLEGAAPSVSSATAHALEVTSAVLPVTLLVTAALAAIGAALHAASASRRAAEVARPVRWRVTAAVTTTAVTLPAVLAPAAIPAVAATDGGICPAGARQVVYDLAAFQTLIPVNGWGDHMPDGLMYALKGADARIGKTEMVANPNLTQPLVIRANVGDCISVTLRNDVAGRRVGIHPDGLVRFDPEDSDGARIGRNPDTTLATGQERTYTWYADREGEAPINDIANLDPTVAGHASVERGLYGAVVVHPRGSRWTDPVTGDDLLAPSGRAVQTSVFADVRDPAGTDYRSLAMVIMDENEDILDGEGDEPTFPLTGLPDSTFGINYRSEPLRNRLQAVLDHREGETVTLPSGQVIEPDDHFCDGWVEDPSQPDGGFLPDDPGAACMGEEFHLQSWPFGDEGKLTRTLADGTVVVDSDVLIPKAYVGDRTKFHVVNPGAQESHPWHQHTQRWLKEPGNPNSPRLDVQTVGPGEAYLLELERGAGGVQGTIGDSIFHCHLYPHFAQGFWGHLRIFDRLRDGTQDYPDGTPIQTLQQLPDRAGAIAAPTAERPGFPLFVEGQVGQRAYRPPHAVVADDFAALRRPGDTVRGPTPLEAANLPALDPTRPGNGFIDPCPAGAPTRTYRPHAIDVPITYNSAGWADPEGRIYVERSHMQRVRSGQQAPEPYTVRARLGDCVQMLTTNSLHLDDDPAEPVDHMNDKDGVYMHESPSSEVSTHVHLVEFDQLGSDGTSVGWNYVQAAMPGQTYGYRWFIDQPLRTIFFHDHQYANSHQQKGLYAALQVEPPDATWHDPRTGQQTDGVGTVADIRSPSGPDFREISIFYQDRSPMWRNGAGGPTAPSDWARAAVHPPPDLDDFGADQGGVAVNYRNEPFQIRVRAGATQNRGDPAYVYSSGVHGDPSTPVFRAYSNDPVVFRFLTGAHEEAHGFQLHGHRWLSDPDDPTSAIVDDQTGTLAEWFNYEIRGGRPSRRPVNAADLARRAESNASNGIPFIPAGGAGDPGDYLYGSANLDDQWMGMWGLFRVPSRRLNDLQPLPDRGPVTGGPAWPALNPGQAINSTPPAGRNECPARSPLRTYDVVAIHKRVTYNARTGDHDPNGAMFVLAQDEAAARAGTKPDEPLFVRANVGDCVRVNLTNRLPQTGLPAHTGDVPLPADVPDFPRSNRVSLHPGGALDYRVTQADGATVGFNFDQTVAPGRTITTYWYVPPDAEGSTVPLVDLADRRGHRHHGLHGALLVEPRGATWTHPSTGAPVTSGAQAVVRYRDAQNTAHVYREFALDFQDGLNLRDGNGNPIPAAGDVDDPYELGNRGVNYRTERFAPRLVTDPQPAWLMSSERHGDPATPLLEAYVGDPVRLRILQSSDRGRAHTIVVSGHAWRRQPNDPNSSLRSFRPLLLPGGNSTHDFVGGAGGPARASGDYHYRDGLVSNQTNAGLWGLLRVHRTPQSHLRPL